MDENRPDHDHHGGPPDHLRCPGCLWESGYYRGREDAAQQIERVADVSGFVDMDPGFAADLARNEENGRLICPVPWNWRVLSA